MEINESGPAGVGATADLTRGEKLAAVQHALELLETSGHWIHRRVTKVSFGDHMLGRQQISVDFTPPPSICGAGIGSGHPGVENGEQYLVPLFLVPKVQSHATRRESRTGMTLPSLHSLDLRNAAGHPIPLTTRAENGAMAVGMMIYLARELAGGPIDDVLVAYTAKTGETYDAQLSNLLAQVVLSDTANAHPALNAVLNGCSSSPVLQRIRTDRFKELASAFAAFSLIGVWLYKPLHQRQIVKLSFSMRLVLEHRPVDAWLRRRLGWKSELVHVPVYQFGDAASHHVEVEPPNDLQITEAGLRGQRFSVAVNDRPRSGWFRRARKLIALLTGRGRTFSDPASYFIKHVSIAQRGHLYLPGGLARQTGVAWVKLRTRRPGFLTEALGASALIAATLWLIDNQAPHLASVSAVSPAVTGLVIIPTVLAAMIVRPNDHWMSAKLLAGARWMLIMATLLPIAVAGRLTTLHGVATVSATKNAALHAHQLALSRERELEHFIDVTRWIALALFIYFLTAYVLPLPHGESIELQGGSA